MKYFSFGDDSPRPAWILPILSRPGVISMAQLVFGISKPLGFCQVYIKSYHEVMQIFRTHLSGANQTRAINSFINNYFAPESEKCAQEIIKFIRSVDGIIEMDIRSLLVMLLDDIYISYNYLLSSCTLFPLLNCVFNQAYAIYPSSITKFLVISMMDMEASIFRGEVTYKEIDAECYDRHNITVNTSDYDIL